MIPKQASQAYFKAEASVKIHPVKLIHMIYERAMFNLVLAGEALAENDVKKRGESLGKAIALITELYASIRSDDDSETAQFLRQVYQAMLLELGRVPVTLDGEVVRRAHRYLAKMKSFWEETAMCEAGFDEYVHQKSRPPIQAEQEQRASLRTLAGLSFSI